MTTRITLLVFAATIGILAPARGELPQPPTDWLIDSRPFVARVVEEKAKHELVLDNGLVRRVVRLTPNAATIKLENLSSGEHLLRAVAPEARVAIDGAEYPVGGLEGQPVKNYVKAEWLDRLRVNSNSYRFTGWSEGPIRARMAWKKHPEWLSRDLPWPPPGKHVVLQFAPPRAQLPGVEVHYELYDGLPLLSKWLVVKNGTDKTVRLTTFTAEELRLAEVESAVNVAPVTERPNLWVETDYAFNDMSPYYAQPAVSLASDPDYPTQVAYKRNTPCLLRCKPPIGPDQELAPGATFESFRSFVLLWDGDRERRTLAQRRMYRTIAPWTAENPLMFHKLGSDPKTIREAIEQAHEVGFEMVIMSFGSGFNLESRDPKYQAVYKQLAEEARAKGIALGGYSLLASRGAGDPKDNTQGQPAMYGVMPCLGSNWGQAYLAQLRQFLGGAGLSVLEHDGSYPGDCCAAREHPGHRGLEDSQWVQWRAITDFYKWCRAEGIFLNIPDWYFLSGGNKTGMGYRETNWSLPRAEQEVIERQNIFDGTWNKTASMGWMFVPLSQYHGGGAAATIEPLSQHLDHYEARLANLVGAGVQACYRGPRLYDTDETKALVKKWVAFYKMHREVLDADLIHLRRANGMDWDGWLHVNPQGKERGLAFFYNPLPETITREIRVPLHYAGLTDRALVSVEGGAPQTVLLDRTETATLQVKIPAHGRTWVLFTAGEPQSP